MCYCPSSRYCWVALRPWRMSTREYSDYSGISGRFVSSWTLLLEVSIDTLSCPQFVSFPSRADLVHAARAARFACSYNRAVTGLIVWQIMFQKWSNINDCLSTVRAILSIIIKTFDARVTISVFSEHLRGQLLYHKKRWHATRTKTGHPDRSSDIWQL